ncbi:Hypothetical predicted protein [Marmota monax]|uniref:Uncharacterized protein n=1 Tax=Marmota monax TaxID=9995 RepID=A0A5E4BQD0_MARMO|nr:Hypothetical predicted protein [Marmota monax]
MSPDYLLNQGTNLRLSVPTEGTPRGAHGRVLLCLGHYVSSSHASDGDPSTHSICLCTPHTPKHQERESVHLDTASPCTHTPSHGQIQATAQGQVYSAHLMAVDCVLRASSALHTLAEMPGGKAWLDSGT